MKQTKTITYKSDDNKTTTTREIYNEIVEEWIDEILRMGNDINHNDVVYGFKGPTTLINFCKYGGPLYICGHMKNGHVTLQQLQKEQKKIKNDLNEIISGNPKQKWETIIHNKKY